MVSVSLCGLNDTGFPVLSLLANGADPHTVHVSSGKGFVDFTFCFSRQDPCVAIADLDGTHCVDEASAKLRYLPASV